LPLTAPTRASPAAGPSASSSAFAPDHALPPPPTGVSLAGHEVDAYWADARLAIEFDGEAFHRTTRAFHEDRRRDRRLAALGIQVSRVTWPDLQEHARLAAELKAIRSERL